MKNIIIITIIATIIESCDIVSPPYMLQPNSDTTIFDIQQNVLVEYFTGHRCPNCPTEALQLKQLKTLYGERLIFISVHAGPFASPAQPNYTTDYRTPAGNELDQHFQVTAISTPNALINRVEYNNSVVIAPTAWATVIAQEINKTPKIIINLQITQNQQQIQVKGIVQTKEIFQEPHFISFYIVEDSLQSYQKNNNPQIGSTPDIPDYYHRYVLRGSVNGTFGEKIFNTAQINEKFEITHSFISQAYWNISKLYVLCFVYNENTGEIVQSVMKKI